MARFKLKAFTLVELLVVIAIIAVLLAVLLPALSSVKEKGKRVKCGNNLASLGRAVTLYCDDNAGYLPPRKGPPPSNTLDPKPYMAYRQDWTKTGGPTGYWPLRLACLYETGLITNPKVFYCQAAVYDGFKLENYLTPTWPGFYSNADMPNNWTRVSYNFKPLDKKYVPNASVPGKGHFGIADKLVDINYNKPWMTDTLWKITQLNHVAGNRDQALGAYASFPDTHVNFCTNPAIFDDDIWHSNPALPGYNPSYQLDNDDDYCAVVTKMEP
jgi:prepilin-type N-terminal cleavage/methylation domain-containing protein